METFVSGMVFLKISRDTEESREFIISRNVR